MSDDYNQKSIDYLTKLSQLVIGKKIISIEAPIEWPGFYSNMKITLEDGSIIEIGTERSGCSECDPDGIGSGLDIDTFIGSTKNYLKH